MEQQAFPSAAAAPKQPETAAFGAAAPAAAPAAAKTATPFAAAQKPQAAVAAEEEPKDPLATGLAPWDLEPPSVVVRRKAKKL